MPKASYHRILDEHLHALIAQGNHEALAKLKRRYFYHSLALCRDLLSQYQKTGISIQELMTVCEDSFIGIVRRYDSSLSSFFSFWKDSTIHRLMDYLVDYAYKEDSVGFKGNISIDQEFDDSHTISDYLFEKDENREKKRQLFEIKNVVAQNEDIFTKQEKTLLNLVLDGYTIGELEHSGVLSRSQLYLTFKNAVTKLRSLIKKIKTNKFEYPNNH